MPICVTGMHRSGTSLVAQVLAACGVDFGPESEFFPADEHNAEGYWENTRFLEVDDSVLEELGGGWDVPPEPEAGWERDARLDSLRDAALTAVEALALRDPWAWKDPRASLLIPFWESIVSDLRVVVCVRHPLEVVRSLRRRGGTSGALGLRLWAAYNRRLVADVGDRGIYVRYDALVDDPAAEAARLMRALDLEVDHAVLADASSRAKPQLRHQRSTRPDAEAVPAELLDLYGQLCVRAGGEAANAGSRAAARSRSAPKLAQVLAADEWRRHAEGLRRDRDNWRERAEQHEREAGALAGRLDRIGAELDEQRRESARRRDALAALEAEVGRLEDRQEALAKDRDAHRADRDRWRAEAGRLLGERERRLVVRARKLAFATARRIWWWLPRFVRDPLRARLFPGSAPTRGPRPRASVSRAIRRRAFPLLRRIWWTLPRGLRERLRARIFRQPDARPGTRAFAPPRIDRTPALHSAPVPAGRPMPRHARPRERATVLPRPPPVSVLMPTLNAGPMFERALAGIAEQEALGEIEVVIVDSGSTDGTVEAARSAQARVIEIAGSEFGHGRTRNLAAEAAEGELLLMLVQDVVPLGRTVFRDLVAELLEDPDAAAVSARQVPRTDADLYGAFVVFSHERVIRSDYERALRKPIHRLTPRERRAHAAVDNVCSAIRRSAWAELRFADVEFAEDLDFGLRAIDAGLRVRRSATATVAHSHDRSAVYHLRRSVADRLYVAERLADDLVTPTASHGSAAVAAAGAAVAGEVSGLLDSLGWDSNRDLSEHLRVLAGSLEGTHEPLDPTGELCEVVELLRRQNGQLAARRPVEDLRRDVRDALVWPPLLEFARAQLAPDRDEVRAFVAKLTAAAIGRAIADSLRLADAPASAREWIVGV